MSFTNKKFPQRYFPLYPSIHTNSFLLDIFGICRTPERPHLGRQTWWSVFQKSQHRLRFPTTTSTNNINCSPLSQWTLQVIVLK